MKHLSGSKLRGKHTTLIDLAATVVEILDDFPEVNGISANRIQNGKAVAGGKRKVKIVGEKRGGILLTVRQAQSVQEVRVYSSDVPMTKLALARALRDRQIPISFR